MLLEAARAAGVRYLQVSTDEVYGSIESGSFTESRRSQPSSPYSATKAGADLLVSSYFHTFGLETRDLPRLEQLRALPVPREAHPADGPQRAARRPRCRSTATGMQVRNWLYVEDFGRGIGHVLEHGDARRGLQRRRPRRVPEHRGRPAHHRADGRLARTCIEYVTDRPGHDRRYSLGSEKVRALGWEARTHFAEGLEQTVAWYRDNPAWWEPIRSGDYREYYERQYGAQIKDCAPRRPRAEPRRARQSDFRS